jgi:ABC-type multidrug transport system fused ATPase/permease subunit
MVTAPVGGPEGAAAHPSPTLAGTVRVLAALIRPHAGVYALIGVLSVVEGVLGGLTIAALFPLFTSLVGPRASGGHGVLAWVQGIVSTLPIQPPIVAAGCFLLLLAFWKGVVALARETLVAYASGRVGYYLRNEMLDRYIRGGYPLFLSHRQGELTYNLYSGCLRVGNLFNQLPLLFAQLVNIAALLALLFSIHAMATLGLVVLAAGLHGAASWVSRRVLYPIGLTKKECMVSQQVIVNEFISGFKQIFVAGTVPAWTRIYEDVNRRFKNLLTREAALLASPRVTWEFLAFAAGAVAMMWLGITNPGGLSEQIVTLGVYFVALQRLLPFLSTLSRQWMMVYGFLPDADTAYRTLRWSPPATARGRRPAAPLARAIRFERVDFAYPERGVLFRDLDIVFERGEVTAVVGASGAGKTTILNLVLGLFQPTAGTIRIDGVDLRDLQLESWLAQIGFVSQDTFIFNGTIRDNIAFFRPCSQEEIEDAARLANAHDFIAEWPGGYDTVVGDRGMRISGGQQQRVALARAILKRPGIFMLDEATSSLDSLSESLIQDSLRKIAVNRTVIVVAHRLSTIVDADRIFVLRDGRVVEAGTHQELLEARGHYAEMYRGSGYGT